MDELYDKIAKLVSDYLVKSTRTFRGNFDFKRQSEVLISMVRAKEIKEIFSFEGDKSYSDADSYRSKLHVLIENRDERDISWGSWQKERVFTQAIADFLARVADEVEASASAAESWRLKQKIADLEAQLEFGKPAAEVSFWDKLSTRINVPFVIVLCLAVVLIAGLTIVGLNAEMTVNVDFNIGEIIGGLLVGTGVAAAGVSYATRNTPSNEERRE